LRIPEDVHSAYRELAWESRQSLNSTFVEGLRRGLVLSTTPEVPNEPEKPAAKPRQNRSAAKRVRGKR